MTHHGRAASCLNNVSVHCQLDFLRCEIDVSPIFHERPFYPCTMTRVVGDERFGSDRYPIIETAVDDFDAGKNAFD